MKAPRPPSGALWLHEIKHGFRVIARKDGARVKLYSRPGNDLTDRFSLPAEVGQEKLLFNFFLDCPKPLFRGLLALASAQPQPPSGDRPTPMSARYAAGC
jgi:hypothetical protein